MPKISYSHNALCNNSKLSYCYCKVKGKGEKEENWWLTLVTASMLAPARQRWRTTSRLPLLADRWRGVLPDWIKREREESFQSITGDKLQEKKKAPTKYWMWSVLPSVIDFPTKDLHVFCCKSSGYHVKNFQAWHWHGGYSADYFLKVYMKWKKIKNKNTD